MGYRFLPEMHVAETGGSGKRKAEATNSIEGGKWIGLVVNLFIRSSSIQAFAPVLTPFL